MSPPAAAMISLAVIPADGLRLICFAMSGPRDRVRVRDAIAPAPPSGACRPRRRRDARSGGDPGRRRARRATGRRQLRSRVELLELRDLGLLDVAGRPARLPDRL